MRPNGNCPHCGEGMSGDGYTTPLHCPTVDVIGEGYEPDCNPIYCQGAEASPQFPEFARVVVDAGIDLESLIRASGNQGIIPYVAPFDYFDYFDQLVTRARVEAEKASRKFPQPNYTTLKIAEEAGEVVRGSVHYAEGRMEWSEVEQEIVQLIAMLIRFVTEGDGVIHAIPPHVNVTS